MMRKIFLTCGVILATTFPSVNLAQAQDLVNAARKDDGTVYQVDLDNREEYYSSEGLRHVRFWLSTRGDSRKYPAVASCRPYDVKSPYYGWNWLPDGVGLSSGTIGGRIARVACNG